MSRVILRTASRRSAKYVSLLCINIVFLPTPRRRATTTPSEINFQQRVQINIRIMLNTASARQHRRIMFIAYPRRSLALRSVIVINFRLAVVVVVRDAVEKSLNPPPYPPPPPASCDDVIMFSPPSERPRRRLLVARTVKRL